MRHLKPFPVLPCFRGVLEPVVGGRLLCPRGAWVGCGLSLKWCMAHSRGLLNTLWMCPTVPLVWSKHTPLKTHLQTINLPKYSCKQDFHLPKAPWIRPLHPSLHQLWPNPGFAGYLLGSVTHKHCKHVLPVSGVRQFTCHRMGSNPLNKTDTFL